MKVETVFISLHAAGFDRLSAWWSGVLGRPWDREPMPSCHEWDLAPGLLFQVLDALGTASPTAVSLRIDDLAAAVLRLREQGIEIADPQKVPGFTDLILTQATDPEGNVLSLLQGR